jgi:hypothetical protein
MAILLTTIILVITGLIIGLMYFLSTSPRLLCTMGLTSTPYGEISYAYAPGYRAAGPAPNAGANAAKGIMNKLGMDQGQGQGQDQGQGKPGQPDMPPVRLSSPTPSPSPSPTPTIAPKPIVPKPPIQQTSPAVQQPPPPPPPPPGSQPPPMPEIQVQPQPIQPQQPLQQTQPPPRDDVPPPQVLPQPPAKPNQTQPPPAKVEWIKPPPPPPPEYDDDAWKQYWNVNKDVTVYIIQYRYIVDTIPIWRRDLIPMGYHPYGWPPAQQGEFDYLDVNLPGARDTRRWKPPYPGWVSKYPGYVPLYPGYVPPYDGYVSPIAGWVPEPVYEIIDYNGYYKLTYGLPAVPTLGQQNTYPIYANDVCPVTHKKYCDAYSPPGQCRCSVYGGIDTPSNQWVLRQ